MPFPLLLLFVFCVKKFLRKPSRDLYLVAAVVGRGIKDTNRTITTTIHSLVEMRH